LFAARTRSKDDFNRELAFQYIPKTIGILRDIFRFISLEDPPKSLKIIVDDISEVLKVTNVKKILHDYYHEGKGKDPIIHFYETFLSEYDPKIRERRGVYYTPEPVVQYIVRSLHQILKTDFKLADGFAAENVTVLDPAAGTLTFPAEAIKTAVEEYSKYGKAGLNNFINKQVLKNFYSFELMMAPYAIGHLKMGFLFEELGYDIGDERFKLYLTNSLEMEELEEIHIPGLSSLSEESHLAIEVKRDKPVLVIMGNPPYSGISANINDWTEQLLKTDIDGAQSYYKVDDKPLGEKKLWLQDDYVKFLRFAQWKIHKAGFGVVGMITNHSYLDNPTFRGMRQSLMRTFNKIYILNLHGNSLKKETAPDGSKDENVFDIRQGVAIALFIKSAQRRGNGGEVYYKDLYGLRDIKYKWLQNNDLNSTRFEKISPQTPYYFFIKRDTEDIQNYLQWPKITEIMPENNVGIVTARDKFVIDFDTNSLKNRINQFCNLEMPDELIKQSYKLKDTSTFNLKRSRKKIAELNKLDSHFEKILYRPFDVRNIFYSKWIVERPLKKIMCHMLAGDNLGLISARSNKSNKKDHFFITDKIMETKCGERTTQSALFPLYLYPNHESGDLFEQIETARKPNIAPKIFEMLKKAFGQVPAPEEILYYIYGVFYSNIYREKYAEFLKIDFPRVSFTSEYELFKEMGELGNRLIDLHLLQSDELSKPVAKYEGSGDNDRIEKFEHNENRVYINSEKHFEGISEVVWDYQIGGYQVLRKYLRDRKGRIMDDPRHYCQIATAIAKTIEIQKQIDEVYLKVEETE
jgi:predicted helicase